MPIEAEVILAGPQRFKTAPFMTWTYDDAKRELQLKVPANYAVNYDYAVTKDHLRNGAEWVGPGTASNEKTNKINQQFAPEDAVGQVLQNVSNAFAEPQLGVVPVATIPEGQDIPEVTKARMLQARTLLSNWFDLQKLQERIQEAQQRGCWSSYTDMRLWIPGRFLDKEGDNITLRPAQTWEQAFSYIALMAPMPDVGTIVVDPATQDKCALYFDQEVLYDASNNKETFDRVELVFLDPERENDRDADTFIRIVYSNKEKPSITAVLKLNGLLTTSEMQVPLLLTDPVIRTQRQLNLLTTLITRIAETAAFRERYTKNAKPQGTRVPYEEGTSIPSGVYLERDAEGAQWLVYPEDRTLGANTLTELVGLPQFTDNGDEKGNQMPEVEIVDPVDPKPYLEAADSVRRRVLRMCSQGHLGGISNAEASGIAYEQARAVFEKDLNRRRVPEEGMLREIFTTVLALAEIIMGQRGYFTNLVRVTVDQHIDPGPRSPDLVRLDLEAYQAGVLSLETTMSRVGVEDIDAEMIRVRRAAQYILDVIEKATTAATAFSPESLIDVLKELNVPPEIIAKLKPAPPKPAPTGAPNAN